MDRLDGKILRLLQQDAKQSVSDIADKIGLSTTPCWRRIQALEKKGVIVKRVALLDAQKLNLGMTVFVQVKAARHDSVWLNKFATHAANIEQIVEFYRMSGEYDYMLKVVVADMQAFDVFYKKLVDGIDLSDVISSFAMEQIKYTTALPLQHHGLTIAAITRKTNVRLSFGRKLLPRFFTPTLHSFALQGLIDKLNSG
jgi:Lrp/AsnC family transcriptional regulator